LKESYTGAMMNKLQSFYQIIFNRINTNVRYVETRQIVKDNPIKRKIFDITNGFDELIDYTKNKNNIYFGVCAVNNNEINRKNNLKPVGGFIAWLDFDIPKDENKRYPSKEKVELIKKEILEIIDNDPLLCDYFAVIDTGHGLHCYYSLGKFVKPKTIESNNKKLIEYCNTVEPLNILIDPVCYNAGRIMRCPESINSKEETTYKCKIVRLKNKTFTGFNTLNNKDNTTGATSRYSTAEAFKLLNIPLPPSNKNIKCVLPEHSDNNPSFHYYAETDTWYCFKCKKGGDGYTLLKHMKRDDLMNILVEQTEKDNDAMSGYKLTGEGKLFLMTKNGLDMRLDLGTNKIIKTYSRIDNKNRVFLYYEKENQAIEITDYPSAKKLRAMINQMVDKTISIPRENHLGELLSVFIQKATVIKKLLVSNAGINELNPDYFFHNGRVFPDNVDYIKLNDQLKSGINLNEAEDIKLERLFKALINDGNYTHILAFLWSLGSIAKDIIIKRFELFPMLIATGVSNSGKSKLAFLVRSMWGTNSETLGSTNFVFINTAKKYGTIPIHFEEFVEKQMKDKEDLLKRIATEIRPIIQRGTQIQTVNEYPITHPVLITGEENIYSKGILSRALVLNVGLNLGKHNQKSYEEWTRLCNNGSVMKWVLNFLEKYYLSFRDYFSTIQIKDKSREYVKKYILIKTLDFLEEANLLRRNMIDRTSLERVFGKSDAYTNVISTNVYIDMLSGVLGHIDFDNPDDENYDNSKIIRDLCDNTFFNLDRKFIVICPAKYTMLYKELNGDRYLKRSNYEAALMQSPDYVYISNTLNYNLKCLVRNEFVSTRKRKLLALKVSEQNKELFFNILCHKLLKTQGIKDYGEVMNKADELLDLFQSEDIKSDNSLIAEINKNKYI